MPLINVQDYYKKLAEETPISPEEIQQLIKAYEVAISLAAYMADCHGATADGLAASAPVSAKKRMRDICDTAARGLDGDFGQYRGRKPEVAQARCRRAVEELDLQIKAHEAEAAQRASERKATKLGKAAP